MKNCLLCEANHLEQIKIADKTYWQCLACDFLFLNPSDRLSAAEEKSRYEKHENNVLDQGYQNFVAPLYEEITKQVNKTDAGLDYGSGKDSAISYLLKQASYHVQKFDPYFYNDPSVLIENTFDYIIVCEVAEHFYDPKAEFLRLKSYLKPGGYLFVMTSLVTDKIDFANWSYRRDSTHVCFYSEKSCQYLQRKFGFKSMKIVGSHIIVFQN